MFQTYKRPLRPNGYEHCRTESKCFVGTYSQRSKRQLLSLLECFVFFSLLFFVTCCCIHKRNDLFEQWGSFSFLCSAWQNLNRKHGKQIKQHILESRVFFFGFFKRLSKINSLIIDNIIFLFFDNDIVKTAIVCDIRFLLSV